MTVNFRRAWATIAILSTIGIYLITLILSRNLSNIINMRFAWLTYLAILMLIGLSIFHIFRLINGQQDEAQILGTTIIFLALPVIFALIFPTQAETIDNVSGRISIEPLASISTTVQGYIPPVERSVLDWLRVFDATDNPAELEGLPVDIVAFIYREEGMPETQFMAARLASSSFTGNNQAVGMPVEFESASNWEDGTWVDIQGRLTVGEFRGEQIAIIIPETIVETDTPDNHINNHDHEH